MALPSTFEECVTHAQVIALLATYHPRTPIPKETVRAYRHALDDIPLAVLQVAALQLVGESKWFPAVSEIRDAAFALVDQAQGVPTQADVLLDIRQAMKEGYPHFQHDITRQVVEALGGWHAVKTSEMVETTRAHIIKTFQDLERERVQVARQLPAVRAAVQRLATAPAVAELEAENV